MMKLPFFTIFSFLICSAAFADNTKFSVTNQHGEILENVVIEKVSAHEPVTDMEEIAIVDQVDKTFLPKHSIIQRGQWVDFPNSDNIRHHVYSFSKAKTFELKLYANRPESPVKFDQHGVVVMGCNIHDSMVGYIYVAQNDQAVLTDARGQASLMLRPEDQVSVWHAHKSGNLEQPLIFNLNDLQEKDNSYQLVINTEPPPEPDTFEAKFR